MGRYRSDNEGPSPDGSVLRGLLRINPGLYPVWKRWVMDWTTGRPLVTLAGDRIEHPRWHIIIDHREKQTHLFAVQDEAGIPLPLDGRVCEKILRDVGRHMTAEQINEMLDAAREERDRKQLGRYNELQQDVAKANKTKISEVFEGDNIKKGPSGNSRDATVFSYEGAPNRKSGAEQQLPTDAKDEGWELPDWEMEMK